VLRPGARALVSSWPPFDRVPSFAALFGAINAELPSPSGGAPPALATAEELHAEMGAAGFRDIEVHEHSVSLGLVAPTELWRSFARGGAPAVWLRKRMGDEPFRAFSERVVARMNETHGPDAREMKLIALLGIGTR